MSKIITAVKSFIADENGVTAIEYGLMAAVIGVGIIGGAGYLGTELDKAFRFVAGKLLTA